MRNGMRAVAAVLGVVIMGGAMAGCKHHCSHGDVTGKLKEHVDVSLKKVGATDEQRKKINADMELITADGQQLYKSNQGLTTKVVGTLLQDVPDSQWLHKTVDEKDLEFTGFAHRAVDRFVAMAAVLNHEQRVELQKRFEAAHGATK